MEILKIIRDALPEVIGGLIVAAIVALTGYLYTRWRKPVTKPLEGEPGPPLPSKPPVPKIPHNLPQPGEFIGREREKAEVREALASRWPLICIDGIGGIGKTALALEAAHECLRASKGELPADGIPTFDTFVWTTAKDRELALSDILDAIARTLDYPYIAQLPPEEKPSESAKLLCQYRCLLIVDNFETITDDAVRNFLLNLPEPSKALITSREQKLRQVRAISLRGMEQGEALALIRSEGKRLGLPAVEQADEKVLLRLYEATGGAPLAIKWAVGQMKQRGQSLDTVLDSLYEARGDVFENIFARSWSLLSESAKRVLMIMPIFAASASKEAIEAASNVHKWDLDEALGQLVEMWLVEASGELDEAKCRYSIHPLTRAFAGARLGEDKEWEREAWLHAGCYFLEFAKHYGGEDWDWHGFDTLRAERENILRIIDWCYNSEEWYRLIDFVKSMGYFFGTRGYWHDRIKYGEKAMQASEKVDDRYSWAWLAIAEVGWTYLKQGNVKKARELITQGLETSEQIGYSKGSAMALRNLGQLALYEGKYEEAEQLYLRSLEIWQQTGDKRWLASTQRNLGMIAQHRGDYGEARRFYEEAQQKFAEAGDEVGTAAILHSLAGIAQLEGNYFQARQLYTESLALSEQVGMQHDVARTKRALATVEEQRGDLEVAFRWAQEALEIYQRLGMQKAIEEAQALVERLEGRIAEARK